MFDGYQTEFRSGTDGSYELQERGAVAANPLSLLYEIEERLSRFEQTVTVQLARVQDRVADLGENVASLSVTETADVVALERQLVALMDRIRKLERNAA